MASTSVFALSRVKVVDFSAALGAGDEVPEDCAVFGAATGAGTEALTGAGAGAVAGVGVGFAGAGVGVGEGLEPPIFSEIVGAGAGASVGTGLSMGGGGGWAGCAACGTRKACPGTKLNAFGLSLLMTWAIQCSLECERDVRCKQSMYTSKEQ